MNKVADQVQSNNPAKFQVFYIVLFSLLFFVTSCTFIILIVQQNFQYFKYDNKVLEKSFKDYIDYLRVDLNRVQSRVEELRISAESDLYESKWHDFKMPFSYKYLKETSINNISEYDMDDIDEEHKDFIVINLTGDGKIRKKDRDFMRVVRMGLNLMDDFDGLKKSVPQIVFTFFIGKDKMIAHYPWISSKLFNFDKRLYKSNPWQLAIPEHNATRSIRWTNVYLDIGEGGGLMTTCVVPIYDGDKFIGDIGADILVNYLNDIVRNFEIERNGEMIIYDRKQHLLAHPSKLSVSDKELRKLDSVLPVALKDSCKQITTSPLLKMQTINGYQVMRGKIKNAPFEVIYLMPNQSMITLLIGKLGWSVIVFLVTLQLLVIGVLIFTRYKFIHPAESLVNFILLRSKGISIEQIPKVPKMWRSWFYTIDKVFDENLRLYENLNRRNKDLADNNKKLSSNYDKLLNSEKENKTLQEQLHKSEKMRALGQLAGGVAHDFNNQLSVILSTASTLKMQYSDNIKQQKSFERILTSTRSSIDLVAQLLAFSKHGKFSIAPVNIHSLINEVEDLIAHAFKKKVFFTKNLSATEMVVGGDSTKLQNAIFNIAINAGKAMPDGGTFSVDTKNIVVGQQLTDEMPTELKPGAYIQIILSDTGKGMDYQTKARIFEPFFTTRSGDGLGMGLSVVYGTIQSHAGHIDVISSPGEGSSFIIYLPVSSAKGKKIKERVKVQNYTDYKKNILLVDDEKDLCLSLSEALTAFGFNVVFYYNCHEAIEYYHKSSNNIDLVLLDMIMPDLSGHDVFVAMREVNPSIKALALSGYATEMETLKMLEEGVELLQKPIEPQVLADKIMTEIER